MRLAARILYSLWASRITGQARHRRARRSGAGIVGPRERRRGGSAGAKPPGSSPLWARSENFVLVVGEPHNGPGAPQARPPERSGDRGAPRAKAWGVRGGEAP